MPNKAKTNAPPPTNAADGTLMVPSMRPTKQLHRSTESVMIFAQRARRISDCVASVVLDASFAVHNKPPRTASRTPNSRARIMSCGAIDSWKSSPTSLGVNRHAAPLIARSTAVVFMTRRPTVLWLSGSVLALTPGINGSVESLDADDAMAAR